MRSFIKAQIDGLVMILSLVLVLFTFSLALETPLDISGELGHCETDSECEAMYDR
jgi:hypothetical protein